MPRNTLTLGLLPEHKRNWRTFLLSYSGCVLVLVLFLRLHLVCPDSRSNLAKSTATEIIPLPNLEKHVVKPQPKPLKPLPAVKFDEPKLVVAKDMPRPKIEEPKIEPPKIQPAHF